MNMLFNDMPDAKHVKSTPITRTEKLARDAWMGHFETTINASLEAALALKNTPHYETLLPQIAYYRHQISTIRWLRELNWQWKEKGK